MSYRVLLVEDNLGDAELLQERLSESVFASFEVIHVNRLAAAFGALSAGGVDVVILDLNLPDSSGLATLTQVCAASHAAPVIVVSGIVDAQMRREAVAAGAEDVLTKEESNSYLFSRSILFVIERNRAREQQRQLEKLLEVTPDAIVVASVAGEVLYVNDTALTLFNRTRDELFAERFHFSVPEGEPRQITILRRIDLRTCEMLLVSFDWKGAPAFLMCTRDVTALKNSQREAVAKRELAEAREGLLRRLIDKITGLAIQFELPDVANAPRMILNASPHEQFSDELLMRALKPLEEAFHGYVESNRTLEMQNRELADAKASVEAANRELEAFSYSVAHDLRSPLSNLSGYSELLLVERGHLLDEAGRADLVTIRDTALRMSELVNDLLQLSIVRRVELQRSFVDISELARGIVERLQKANPQREVDFVVAPGLVVQADRGLMHVLLDNLLGNAHKFTNKRRLARIELGVVREAQGDVYFVRDNGAGFKASDAHKLFNVFQRLHSREDFDGTGVGLSIVKRIVERHGGRVWAEGASGHGATFYFSLGALVDDSASPGPA